MQAVLQNTATKLILQQADDESAEKCAKLVGSEETAIQTVQTQRALWMGPQETGLGSEREGWTYIAHPDVVKTLGVGEGFLITKGYRGRIRTPNIPVPRWTLPTIRATRPEHDGLNLRARMDAHEAKQSEQAGAKRSKAPETLRSIQFNDGLMPVCLNFSTFGWDLDPLLADNTVVPVEVNDPAVTGVNGILGGDISIGF